MSCGATDPSRRPEAQLPLHHPMLATVLWSLVITAVMAPLSIRAFRERSRD